MSMRTDGIVPNNGRNTATNATNRQTSRAELGNKTRDIEVVKKVNIEESTGSVFLDLLLKILTVVFMALGIGKFASNTNELYEDTDKMTMAHAGAIVRP